MRTQVPYILVPKYIVSACVIKVMCTCEAAYKQVLNSKQFVYNIDIMLPTVLFLSLFCINLLDYRTLLLLCYVVLFHLSNNNN